MVDNDYSLLLAINDDIANIKDNEKLFITIFAKLKYYYDIEIGGISLYDKNRNYVGVILASNTHPDKIYPYTWYQSFPTGEFEEKVLPPIAEIQFLDKRIFSQFQKQKMDQPEFTEIIQQKNIDEFICIPMKTGGEMIGHLILPEVKIQSAAIDEEYLGKIANLIAAAIVNSRSFEDLRQKEEIKEIQLRLLSDLVTQQKTENIYLKLGKEIDKLLPNDFIALYGKQFGTEQSVSIAMFKDANDNLKLYPTDQNINIALLALNLSLSSKERMNFIEITGDDLLVFSKQTSFIKKLKEKNGINSFLILKYTYEEVGELVMVVGRKTSYIWTRKQDKLDFMFLQKKNSYFSDEEINLGLSILPPTALVITNAVAFEEIKILSDKLEQEKSYLLDEINLTNSFQEIVGNSPAIQITQNKIKQVAPLDVTVLILGETGTGKELIARATHNLSNRKENAFITVNCAALPAQLIESELFGHEKGSFTGAFEKRIGRFEVADGGTIFLDEIGELPLEIQAKLLRVLQEKEFERLGGKSTIRSDVRIVAATNRDLEREVELGKFRADLFFRLNVFPILVPPLRERIEDIPQLVKYFSEKYSKKIGREVKSISKNDLDILMGYNWPGNVRELEHLTERAIIVSEGQNLNFEELLSWKHMKFKSTPDSFKKLAEMEKDHILYALQTSGGKITGTNSAAQLLGIKGKTLGSKMRKLGIKRGIIVTTV